MNDPVTVTFTSETIEHWLCTPGGEFELEDLNSAIDEANDRAKLFGEATIIIKITAEIRHERS